MQASQTSVFARDDTLLGVCHALGEDFGFNPLYLRIALAVLILWNPVVVLAVYAGAGVLVVLSRLISPNPKSAARSDAEAVTAPVEAEAAEVYAEAA